MRFVHGVDWFIVYPDLEEWLRYWGDLRSRGKEFHQHLLEIAYLGGHSGKTIGEEFYYFFGLNEAKWPKNREFFEKMRDSPPETIWWLLDYKPTE